MICILTKGFFRFVVMNKCCNYRLCRFEQINSLKKICCYLFKKNCSDVPEIASQEEIPSIPFAKGKARKRD